MLIDRSGGSNKSVTASAPVEIVINRAMRATVQILGSLMHHRAPAKIRGYLALPTFLQKRDQLILLISAGALTAYLAERKSSNSRLKHTISKHFRRSIATALAIFRWPV